MRSIYKVTIEGKSYSTMFRTWGTGTKVLVGAASDETVAIRQALRWAKQHGYSNTMVTEMIRLGDFVFGD